MCEDSLSFAKYMKSLSTGLRRSKIKLLTARLTSILEYCQFSEQTAREAASQNRMKKLTQIYTVIVDIITSFRDPKKQATRFEEFTSTLKAAFKACPTLHSMNEGYVSLVGTAIDVCVVLSLLCPVRSSDWKCISRRTTRKRTKRTAQRAS